MMVLTVLVVGKGADPIRAIVVQSACLGVEPQLAQCQHELGTPIVTDAGIAQ